MILEHLVGVTVREPVPLPAKVPPVTVPPSIVCTIPLETKTTTAFAIPSENVFAFPSVIEVKTVFNVSSSTFTLIV